MSVRRRQNWVSQGRTDVPHMKSVESAVSNDFDELLRSFVLGEEKSYVLRGFDINMSGAIGGAASGLEVIVEEGSIFHGKSSQSGTFFVVPSGTDNEVLNSNTNDRVDGAFTPSSLNYIGLEFTRGVDDSTTAQTFLFNPTSLVEISKTLPQAIMLDYKIVVTSSTFASNVLPLSIVETDSNNNVISIEDRRPMLFRLGSAGSSTPDPFADYGWDNHVEGRSENFYKSTTTTSPFKGGDKQILTLKEWMDAVMSNIKEVKGTTYWYSENPAGSIYNLRTDLANTQITGSGTITHSAVTAGQMNWDSDMYLDLIGSRLTYKILANPVSTDVILSDNQVAYIRIVRGVDITPKLIFSNGSPLVSSVGAVAWTSNVSVGDWIKIKTADDTLYYQIQTVNTASQVTLENSYQETSTGSSGTEAQYAYGFYQTNAAPSTDRHVKVNDRRLVPFEDDIYWFFLRADKGGPTAKVYMRGSSGGEIEQGESIQVSDNTSLEVLQYIGSPSEADTTPDYTNSIAVYTSEITSLTFGPAAAMTTGQSFNMNSASNINKHYFWANIAGGGGNPYIPGRIGNEVILTGTENAVQVANAFHAVINALGDFNSLDPNTGTLSVENSQVGSTDDATNNDIFGLSISVTQQGLGKANCVVVDNENLTRSIKRLDESVCDILESLDSEVYREKMTVVSGAPANDNEIQGPVAINTIITIPLNSRDGDILPEYEVDGGTLEVFLNGHLQCPGKDYIEVGLSGDMSTEIQILNQLFIDYELEFRFREGGAGGGGAGSTSTGVNLGTVQDADVFKQTVGTQLQFRRLVAGSGVTIIEGPNDISIGSTPSVAPKSVINISANYTVQSTDDVVLASNVGSNITITLPSATSSGRELVIKKIDTGNTLFIKSVSNQTLDGVDIDVTPYQITILNDSITIIANGTSWFVI